MTHTKRARNTNGTVCDVPRSKGDIVTIYWIETECVACVQIGVAEFGEISAPGERLKVLKIDYS